MRQRVPARCGTRLTGDRAWPFASTPSNGWREGGRWQAFAYDKLEKRDKLNLDLLWLRDSALEDGAHLPDPEVLAAEIVEDLHAALEAFQAIAEELES